MHNGWIKIYRDLDKKGFYRDSHFVHLWIHVLLKANHREAEFMWNGKLKKLKRGQFLTGRKALQEETGINEHKIERILKLFESEQQIEQQKTNRFRLITVKNYEKYQDREQQNAQQMSNKCTTDEQQMSTNKNDKNKKNERNIISPEGQNSKKNSGPQSIADLLPNYKPYQKSVTKWQDDAAAACKELNAEKKSSVFKCFKDDSHRARIAMIDCRELGKLSENYFFKVYNNLKNGQGG